MKSYKYLLIAFILITFLLFSCASPDRVFTSSTDGSNNILLGFWHGIIIPFSVIGKLIGFNIGIYESGRDLGYFIGFAYAASLYFRLTYHLWTTIKQDRMYK